MRQFIRYLYEYSNGKRVRNVGFIKVEKQADKCTIHIHGKGLDLGEERKLVVYVFYMQNEQCIGVQQGVIENGSPVINYILKFEAEDVGDAEKFERVDGIILQSSGGRKYAAMWNDNPVDVENMRTQEETTREEERVPEVESESENESEVASVVESAEANLHETLLEHVEKLVTEQEVEIEENEEVEQYISPRTRTYEKIQRQDISRLPRREWKLANNSFLLHGFYNYHHLLYIEEDGNCWIGVPGIYHEKERTAARAFGFPQFHRITDADVELSNEEKNIYDDFGYWCRQVESQSL